MTEDDQRKLDRVYRMLKYLVLKDKIRECRFDEIGMKERVALMKQLPNLNDILDYEAVGMEIFEDRRTGRLRE
jgi:hypothetical protein